MTKKAAPKGLQEISCSLWRRGPEIRDEAGWVVKEASGYVARIRCDHFANGKCSHKAGPMICPTKGLRSILK